MFSEREKKEGKRTGFSLEPITIIQVRNDEDLG